jgi:hypothetical protein
MKFIAALLVATASADWVNPYGGSIRSLDMDGIVYQLSARNEDRVRTVRDEAEVAIVGLKDLARDAIDARVQMFDEEIFDIKYAISQAVIAKRAALAELGGFIRETQEVLNDEIMSIVDGLNLDQDYLIEDILVADEYGDDMKIEEILVSAGKSEALTPYTYHGNPDEIYETYLSY